LSNYWRGWGRVLHRWGGISTQALRGLGALRVPGNLFVVGSLSSDPNRALRVGVTAEHWRFYGDPQRGVWMSGSLAWRPSARQELAIEPTWSSSYEPVQLLGHGAIDGTATTVVGSLHTSSLALITRATYVVRPNLSVQFYAQPFIAAGRSTAIRQVVDGRAPTHAGRFASYAPDQILDDGTSLALDVDRDGSADLALRRPDYRILSLNSNLIVRWEYLPGSSLFLVWQHGRSEDRRPGGADLFDGMRDLFSAGAENRLILKASYWMGLR
jgi:hypothetical protein